MDWSQLWAVNKKYIDNVLPRHTAVIKKNMVKAAVEGASETACHKCKPKHGKNPGLGTKKVAYSDRIWLNQEDARSFTQNKKITLMNWGNAFVQNVHESEGLISSLELKLHLPGDVEKTKKKVTWLSKKGQQLVPIELVDFNYLITKDKLEKEDNIEDFLTPQTEFREEAVADCNVADLRESDIIQFERKGYYRVDRPFSEGRATVMFSIPTGKGTQYIK